MTGLSSESAGATNYVRKEEFRRYLDREIRAEGYDSYRPNPSYPGTVQQSKDAQSIPTGSSGPITLISEVELANGRVALIAGNQTTLWRYYGLEDPKYYAIESNSTYYEVGDGNITITEAGETAANQVYSYWQTSGNTTYWKTVSGDYLILKTRIGTTSNYLYSIRRVAGNVSLYISGPTNVNVSIGSVVFHSTGYGAEPAPQISENTTYYEEDYKGWIQIGSGFSTQGSRWESVRVGDYIVLNNGYDLPVTYRLDEQSVKPIYELREQQVASVGTIGALDDILICMDIRQINTDSFNAIMQDIPADTDAEQQSYGKIWPSLSQLFPSVSNPVGLSIYWASGEQRTVKYVDSGYMYVDNDQTVPLGPCSIENPLAYAAYTGNADRYGWRVFPSMPSQPRRFGAVAIGSMTAGENVVKFKYPVRSISELFYTATKTAFNGDSLPSMYLTQAGLNGGNLISNIQWIPSGSAKSMQIVDFCQNTTVELPIVASDAQASFAGIYQDLIDDGSSILRGMQLRDAFIIYKSPSPTPSIFIGTYTGSTTAPFTFQRFQLPNVGQALHYKNVLIQGGSGFYASHHIYAGRNAFYKIDLYQQTPTELAELTPCQAVFFDQADTNNAFVAENHLTREIWFCYGDGGALCLDYALGTSRTTDIGITAAAKARHPVNGSDWFIMSMLDSQSRGVIKRFGVLDQRPRISGTVKASSSAYPQGVITSTSAFFTTDDIGTTIVFDDGNSCAIDSYVSSTQVNVILLTGKVTAQKFKVLPSIWHHDGTVYNSVIESGVDDFGAGNSEKSWNEYSLVASSMSPTATVGVVFRGGSNPGVAVDLQSGTITKPQRFNNLRPTVVNYYLGDRVTVTGPGPFEITSREFRFNIINSHGFGNLPR